MKRMLPLSLMLASIVLMILPFGVRMAFANPDGPPFIQYYSYFSEMPIGYGNFFPILTVILSLAVIITLAVKARNHTQIKYIGGKVILICLCGCLLLSLLSWIVFNAISIVGVFVAVLHSAALAMELFGEKCCKKKMHHN